MFRAYLGIRVEAMGNHRFSDIFPQSEVLRRLGNMHDCIYYNRNKHIDLFPRTSAVVKMAILRSKKP